LKHHQFPSVLDILDRPRSGCKGNQQRAAEKGVSVAIPAQIREVVAKPMSTTTPTDRIRRAACLRLAPLVAALPLLFAAAGCEEPVTEDDPAFPDLEARVSEHIPTVVTVAWTATGDDPDEAYVEYETPSLPTVRVDAELVEDEWQAFLFGLKASTEYTYRAAAVVAGETRTSQDGLFATGSPPSSLPSITVDDAVAAQARGGYLLTATISTPSAIVLLDMDGDYLWWHEIEETERSARHAYFSTAGDSIVLMADGLSYEGNDDHTSILRYVSLDGSEVTDLEFEGIHHDFVQLPDGALIAIKKQVVVVEHETGVAADTLIEIQPDGTYETLWSMWDEVECAPENALHIADNNTLGNSLDYVPETDTLYMGTRNLGTIFAIDRAAGEVQWRLGGTFSDFADPQGDTTLTVWQHQFQVLDDGILVFDNNNNMMDGSRIVEFELDHDTGTAHTRWEYTREEPTFCYALGDVTRFDDGNTMVTWSTSGMYEEVTADGELSWRMTLDLGAGLGYTTWYESLDDLLNP